MLYVGTAGWSIPAASRDDFPAAGSHLERYGSRLNAVEINSSFYRPHRASTYARWAASVPPSFAFSLKVPKEITHVRRFVDCGDELDRFLDDSAPLGKKRRIVLLQLPPSFAYDRALCERFFALFRNRYAGTAVCEPRHPSWFTCEADGMLTQAGIGRVAADPAICEAAAVPGGCLDVAYYRWHGSPRTYYSRYEPADVDALAARIAQAAALERWAIFDNTALGAATQNALSLAREAGNGAWLSNGTPQR